MVKTIYTSLDDFKLKRREVKSYTCLGEDYADWIDENTIKLLTKRNSQELRAGEELKRIVGTIHEQVFFMINGRSYFLDYYLPNVKIAIEIDGSYHKCRRIEDKVRDIDFQEIGIRTIRVNSSDVMKGDFITVLRNKLKPKKKKGKLYG